jgi:Delta14-sterol reductase
MASATKAELNPRTQHYEFLGPPGALFITLTVPAITYALFFGCSETSGGCPPALPIIWPSVVTAVSDSTWWKSLWDPQAFVAYFAWYTYCVVAWAVLPGDWIEGTLVRDGTRKLYKINGIQSTYVFSSRNS